MFEKTLQGVKGIAVPLLLSIAAILLLPGRAVGQSGTVTDDAFLSSNSAVQLVNLGGQGGSLIVAGSGATMVWSVWARPRPSG